MTSMHSKEFRGQRIEFHEKVTSNEPGKPLPTTRPPRQRKRTDEELQAIVDRGKRK